MGLTIVVCLCVCVCVMGGGRIITIRSCQETDQVTTHKCQERGQVSVQGMPWK